MGIEVLVAWVLANPASSAAIGGMAVQGWSWLVKKSPWGWDDDLLSWGIKNKAGLSLVARLLAKKK